MQVQSGEIKSYVKKIKSRLASELPSPFGDPSA